MKTIRSEKIIESKKKVKQNDNDFSLVFLLLELFGFVCFIGINLYDYLVISDGKE